MDTPSNSNSPRMADRFRGFLPVVVDVETGGFDAEHDALLEIAAIPLAMDEGGFLHLLPTVSTHVEPFPGANLDPRSLEITGIDPTNPLRGALAEKLALDHIFQVVRDAVRDAGCQRAILVGHNAAFDLGFLNQAVRRTGHKRNPFHPFSCFDTVSFGGLAYGQTVLSKAVLAAGLEFDGREAHSAVYDTERTAQLFCSVVNRWRQLELLEQAHDGLSAR
ncbi:ribonuclease T [Rhodanobacter sp. AS-Z3]|uniref:ribonuclease T n=1 Tax=Rhodanobacter sp. AS-Z3 TaxID=3031330 RepID=UPI002478C1F5|nr:ribonuclease T [Rhodanobacter sp. AS-Z3]WEN13645.1 ribonuclease T [Rhodanobacter sp. AS-Z3]